MSARSRPGRPCRRHRLGVSTGCGGGSRRSRIARRVRRDLCRCQRYLPGDCTVDRRTFANFVDGGVVGPPVQAAGSTRLYLSGDARTRGRGAVEGHVARDAGRRRRCGRSVGREGLFRGVDEGDRCIAAGHSRARCCGGRRGCVARRVGDIDAGSRRAGERAATATLRRRGGLPVNSTRLRRLRRPRSARRLRHRRGRRLPTTCPVQRCLRHHTSGCDQRNAFRRGRSASHCSRVISYSTSLSCA